MLNFLLEWPKRKKYELDYIKCRLFVYEILNVIKMVFSYLDWVENIVAKGENAG